MGGRSLREQSVGAEDFADRCDRARRARARGGRAGAREGLEALAASVSQPIARIAIRVCAPLPPTTEERIRDARAASMADSILYREALANAAEGRGWVVHWYERGQVLRDASNALGGEDVDALLRAMGRAIGPPWNATYKLAATAALASA